MAADDTHKNVWFTNQECEIAGTYVANHCGTRYELNYKIGNKFVRCPACGQSVEWTFKERP